MKPLFHKYALLAGFAVWFATVAIAASSEKTDEPLYKFFEPTTTAKRVEIKVSGKLRPYFMLEPGVTIEVPIRGTAKLKLMSRIVLQGMADSVGYSYVVERKGGKKVTVDHETHRSDRAVFATEQSGGIGESRSKVLDVPKGEQVFILSLPAGSTDRILFRFGEDASAWGRATSAIAMTPSEFSTEVDLITKEETTSYYRIGNGDRVVLSLVGPASLKVLSRIEFDASMSGKQKWRVSVSEDGKEKAGYSLSASKSDQTTYKQTTDLVPSAAQTFYVEIPAGPHKYEFLLPDNHRTALMRFVMPQSQLDRN